MIAHYHPVKTPQYLQQQKNEGNIHKYQAFQRMILSYYYYVHLTKTNGSSYLQ
jgi:hypothetical protein